MTRIVENDGSVIIGYVIEKRNAPVPYLRIRRFEKLEADNPVFVDKGRKRAKVGFGTDIVFLDDIELMEIIRA